MKIHGMGRIIFKEYDSRYIRIEFLSDIPNGPVVDERFIQEGAEILVANPEWELPPLLVVAKDKKIWDKEYWVIDGRHRRASYSLAERTFVPVVIGSDIVVLPKEMDADE